MAQTGAGAAREALEREFPGVVVIERGDRVRTVFGRPMTTGATAREAMEDWMFLYGDVFGVDDLEWIEARDTEISRGRVAFALPQEVTVEGGILPEPTRLRVEDGRLRALVAPVEGPPGESFAVTYVSARIKDTSAGVPPPLITGPQAIAAAGLDARTAHLKVWSEPELMVIEHDFGTGSEVFAAWRVVGMESEEAFLTSLVVYVDAGTSEVVRVQPGIMHADSVSGTVTGKATLGLGPPLTNTASEQALPDLIVSIVGEASTTTDGNGDYVLETSSGTVDVKFSLDAGYWVVFDTAISGTPSHTQMSVSPPASGVDHEFNNNPGSQEDTAPVNAFLNVRMSNQFFAERVPPWTSTILPSLQPLLANVNGGCECGAWFLPTMHHAPQPTLNFCGSSQTCNNAAYSTIVSHEYAHYVAYYVVEETHPGAFHEGYGDSASILIHDTGIIGMDLHLDPNDPHIRTPSTADITYPACPDQGNKWTRGQLLGRIWWDILTNGTSADPIATARLLFADWTMLTNGSADPHGECLAAGGSPIDQPADTGTLLEVLTADDDDLDISNGTPNDLVICQAFADRDIETQFATSPCPASLHGGGGCRADMNYDGDLDILDFLEFQNAFAAAHPFADFTGDRVLDFFDFLAFENEFAAGCW